MLTLYRHPIMMRTRRELGDTIDLQVIDDAVIGALKRTRFVGVGNPSESGPHLLYYLRQENELPASLFVNVFELPGFGGDESPSVDHFVFIDDLCGTGEQACSYADTVVSKLRERNPEAKVSYFALLATERGLERTRRHSGFNEVDAVIVLDDTFRCFSPSSRLYGDAPSPIDREVAKNLALAFGRLVNPKHPLGFGDAELVVGFSHNTPDDTLPIFWVESNEVLTRLRPVFRRYGKSDGEI